MTVDGFIPEVWAARLLLNLHNSLIAAQPRVVNRDYEGDISQKGDTVHIGGIGPITIKTYTKNTDIDAPETLDDEMQNLVIDQADYFNFQVDDVDARQTAVGLLDGAIAEAAFGMASEADRYLLDKMADEATAAETAETTDAYEVLVDMGVQLDEANVPAGGRFAIVPPWWHGILLRDDRFVGAAALSTSGRALLTGQVGEAAGFVILKSNQLPVSSADYSVIAGHPIATTFADQINKTEAFRPERRFGDAVKGLHLYGAKVIRPEALVVFTATRP